MLNVNIPIPSTDKTFVTTLTKCAHLKLHE